MIVRKIQQTRSNNYLLGKLNLGDSVVIALFSVICLIAGVRTQAEVLVAVTFLMSLFYSFKNLAMSLAFVVVAGPIIGELSSGFFQILVYAPFLMCSFFKAISTQKGRTANMVYCCCLLIAFLSFVIGYKPELVTLLLQIVSMTVFYCIWKTFYARDVTILCFALLCSAIIVCTYVFSGGIENNMYAGRLALGDNIKKLSIVCAMPLSFLIYAYVNGSSLVRNLSGKFARWIQLIITIFLIAILFMTLARGIFLAFGIGVFVLLLLSKNKIKTYYLFFLVAVAVFYLSQYITSFDLFRAGRLMEFDEMSTGNGRTEIWSHYIGKMSEMGLQYVIFGVGPGEISRISTWDYYAHSTILDYYFSYGLIGLTIFLLIQGVILRKLYKYSNKVPFVIAITILFSYATHGSAANLELFVLEGILVAITKIDNYESIRSPQLV